MVPLSPLIPAPPGIVAVYKNTTRRVVAFDKCSNPLVVGGQTLVNAGELPGFSHLIDTVTEGNF